MSHVPVRILFVDDSLDVIRTHKAMMNNVNAEWIPAYAIGGPEAVAQLDTTEFDVIVTDIDMPVFNGIKLLKYVQKKYPHLIRIIYSGSLTKETVREVAACTHRFIAKPSTRNKLLHTIENTLFIHRNLDNKKIRKILTKTGTLPTLPKVYQSLMDQIDNDDFSLRDAAKIIRTDVGMSANILKQINLLGQKENISTIDQAVALLGLNTIKAIALSSHIFNTMNSDVIRYFSPEQLARHSMLTALFAKQITIIETDDSRLSESAYIGGLLHDIGAILFAENFSNKYEDVLSRVVTANRPISEVEQNLIGISHSEIGAYLLALWGFSTDILEAVAFHETPDHDLPVSFNITIAVYVANIFAHVFEGDRDYTEELISKSLLENSNCLSRYQLWFEECSSIYKELE